MLSFLIYPLSFSFKRTDFLVMFLTGILSAVSFHKSLFELSHLYSAGHTH